MRVSGSGCGWWGGGGGGEKGGGAASAVSHCCVVWAVIAVFDTYASKGLSAAISC